MKYYLDAEQMKEAHAAHVYLKHRMGFPDYYGNNLDALFDVLSESEGMEVEFLNMSEENQYVKRIIKVMKAAGVTVV